MFMADSAADKDYAALSSLMQPLGLVIKSRTRALDGVICFFAVIVRRYEATLKGSQSGSSGTILTF